MVALGADGATRPCAARSGLPARSSFEASDGRARIIGAIRAAALAATATNTNATARAGTQQLATTAGLFVSAHWALALGRLSLSAGPQAEVLARPLIVQIGYGEVFRMPSFLAGFTVDADVDLGD
jgi:hypothetical protein